MQLLILYDWNFLKDASDFQSISIYYYIGKATTSDICQLQEKHKSIDSPYISAAIPVNQ